LAWYKSMRVLRQCTLSFVTTFVDKPAINHCRTYDHCS
jgi:hypothetical protein